MISTQISKTNKSQKILRWQRFLGLFQRWDHLKQTTKALKYRSDTAFQSSLQSTSSGQVKLKLAAKKKAIEAKKKQLFTPDELESLWDLLQTYNEDLDDKVSFPLSNVLQA